MTTIISGSAPSITFSDSTTQSSGIASTAGVVGVSSGGTGASTLTANNVLLGNGTSAVQVVAPSTSGNILTSNGTTWVSQAPAAGGVTSVATGNGLSGGTITSTGTLVIACPTQNTVGSYAFAIYGAVGTSTTVTFGSNYSAGSGASNIKSGQVETDNGGGAGLYTTNELSGTWKWMGGSRSINLLSGGIACRVS